jgi:hypothetical protein
VASGISGLDLKKPALSFKMPGNGVSLTARFVSDNMYADFTGDDKINILDLIRLKKFLLGENVSMNNKSGDLNADGSTDGLDLIRLMKYLLGEAVELH